MLQKQNGIKRIELTLFLLGKKASKAYLLLTKNTIKYGSYEIKHLLKKGGSDHEW